MPFLSALLLLATLPFSAFAQTQSNCGGDPTPAVTACEMSESASRVNIPTDGASVPGTICKVNGELLVFPDLPVKKEHLLYFGLNAGLPFMGYDLTYVQKMNARQVFHASLGIEGSLGSSALSLKGGYHPWGNSIFAGGTARVQRDAHGNPGFMLGPTIGLSGGGRRITGQLGISFLGELQTLPGMTPSVALHVLPEVSMGIRIRLFKSRH
jgi:hypothetical protein